MPTLRERLSSLSVFFFSDVDDALSAEHARNESTRLKVVESRLEHDEFEQKINKEISALDKVLKKKRDHFALQAKPMLEEFDEIGQAEHFYDQIVNSVLVQEQMTDQMAKREVLQYGYMSKKLNSVALNFECLQKKMLEGGSFKNELRTMLDDADSEDLNQIAAPLFSFDDKGVPSTSMIRDSAFHLARAMEDSGKVPVQEPAKGWLDFLKFTVSFSPSVAEKKMVEFRRQANTFSQRVDLEDYVGALELVDSFIQDNKSLNCETDSFFQESYLQFKAKTIPLIASRMFLDYTTASLNASRFACVEDMLKN